MGDRTEFLDGADLTAMNENHNPSRDPSDIQLKDGFVLLHRYAMPQEETRAGVIHPVKEGGEEQYKFKPNGSRIVAVGPNVKRSDVKLGRYAFWVMVARPGDEPIVLPQPIVYQWTDLPSNLWVIHEDQILFTIAHAGDPEWLEFSDDDMMFDPELEHHFIQVKSMTGRWLSCSPGAIRLGEVFRLVEDGAEYRALGSMMGVERDDERGNKEVVGPWKVFCAPTTTK